MTGVNDVTAASAATAANPPSVLGGLGKDAFLQLLVAQLKYQNPLSPVDGQQYLQQTAQFTMVEKLEDMARGQSELMAWQRSIVAEGMVGRHVVGTGADGNKVEGMVTAIKLTQSGPTVVLDGKTELPVDCVDEVRT